MNIGGVAIVAAAILLIAGVAGTILWFRLRLGPDQLTPRELAQGRRILRIQAGEAEAGWSELGARTEAKGLDLRFFSKDAPDASATLRLPGAGESSGIMTNRHAAVLTRTPRTHHVHSGGFVFRTSLAGDGPVEGRKVILTMELLDDAPAAIGIENDRERSPAQGAWIRVEWVEVLDVRPLEHHTR